MKALRTHQSEPTNDYQYDSKASPFRGHPFCVTLSHDRKIFLTARCALLPALTAGFCLTAAGCTEPPVRYTIPAGTVDPPPVKRLDNPAGKLPEHIRILFDPAKGRPVQVFADEVIGGRVADFVAFHEVRGHSAKFLSFYPEATVGPGPGLCRSRVYVPYDSEDKTNPSRIKGRWAEDVYTVAGSVAPLPEPSPPGYVKRLQAACRARRDMGLWYSSSPRQAYAGARLADAVVASARSKGALPFKLDCRPFPTGSGRTSRCADDVRSILAEADPRAIVQVTDCHEESKLPCLAVHIGKRPQERGPMAEDRWTLSVQYRDQDKLSIARVEVSDTVIDFE